MKRSIKIILTVVASISMMMTTMTQVVLANDGVEVSARLNGKGYVAPASLGDAINDTTTLTSAVYDEVDGELYAYSMANGGYFNVVKVSNNELVYSELIQGVQQVWAHTVTEDHVVYMAALGPANDGWLLRYDPQNGKIEDLGREFPGYQYWSITSDGKDNIYIGTFKEKEAIIIKYNIASQKYENLGVVGSEKELGYVRSIAYHDNKLYLGMGVNASVYQMDLSTKEVVDITQNTYDLIDKPGNKEDIKYVYDMSVVKNHLVARFDHDGMGAILLYNLNEQKWEDKVLKKDTSGKESYGAFGWNSLIDNDGKTYISFERQLHELDTNTLTEKAIGGGVFGFRGAALYDFGEGPEFVTSERLGSTLRIKLEDGRRKQVPNVMRGSALKLHNLGKDNNGDLYVTTYPGGPKGAKYSMQDEKYTSYAQTQAEGMIAGKGNTMYFGEYPGAVIKSMDTQTLELKTLFNLKDNHEQDRPYIMKYEDDLLLIGTIPDYKKLGGTLSIYNPDTNDLKTYRNVVENQSIVGLAKKGNYIYGSTTTKGGLDSTSTAKKPVIFVWDIENEKKVNEIELEIPGLNDTPMISGLSFDENGMLWGAVDGFLFTLNPDTLKVENYKNIYPNVGNRGMWRPVHIEFGDDGFVYSDVAGKLTVVDPSTEEWDHTTISTKKEVDFMTLSYDKEGSQNIYIVQADPTAIEVVKIVDVDPIVEEDKTVIAKVLSKGVNLDFEDSKADQVIPGWSSLFGTITENVSFEVTSEKAYSGQNSMKITDTSDQETVFAISDPIKVKAGETYTAESMLYLKDGMNTLMLRYYDDEGKAVNKDVDGVNIIHIRSGYNEWRKVSATVTAPEGATNARIAIGSSKYFQTTGAYFDDIRLYSEQEIEAIKLKKIEKLVEEFVDIDASLFTEESYKEALVSHQEAEEIISVVQEEELLFAQGISEEDFENRVLQVDVDAHYARLEKAVQELEERKDEDKPTEEPKNPDIDKDNSTENTVDPEKEVVETPSDTNKDNSKEVPETGLNAHYGMYIIISVVSLVLFIGLRRKAKN